MMKKLPRLSALLFCLVLPALPALAQQDEGVAVERMSRLRGLVPEKQLEEQATMQYQELKQQAAQKGVLPPDTDPQLQRVRAGGVRVLAVNGNIAPGQGGPATRLLQRGLAKLHYAVPRSGVDDAGTQRAVLAWRKVTHRPRTFTASRDVLLGVLAGRGAWAVRHPGDGHHVEADLSLQVLALVDGSRVHRIYHMSSGKPSTPTILGRFRVYRKEPGTNAHGMVDSDYFIGGYAIHGYESVPVYNASHGCLRVPIPDAPSIYRWVRMGDVVWVER